MTLTMRMRVIPEQTRRMIGGNFNHIVERFAGLGQHIDDIVLWRLRRNRKTVKMEIRHVHARRDRAAFLGVSRQIVHVVDLERISGRNSDRWGNTLALVNESISAIGIKRRMQGKRSDMILPADFPRRGNGMCGVSTDAYRHETKSSNTSRLSNTHNNNLSS